MKTPSVILIAIGALLIGAVGGYLMGNLLNNTKEEKSYINTQETESTSEGLKNTKGFGGDEPLTSDETMHIAGRVTTSGPSGISGSGSGGSNRKSSDIYKVVSRITSSAKTKYETPLHSNPNLKGTIIIRFTIEMNGSVSSSSIVSNDTGDPSFGNEIMSLIRHLNFGSTDRGNTVVVVPFTFSKE